MAVENDWVWVLERIHATRGVTRWVLSGLDDDTIREHLGWVPDGLWPPPQSLLGILRESHGIDVNPAEFDDLLIGKELLVPMTLSGITTGLLNATLARGSVASVPPDQAAMASGANSTARYLGAASGITLFAVVAAHTGTDITDGWNNAVIASAVIVAAGAAVIALAARGRSGTDAAAPSMRA